MSLSIFIRAYNNKVISSSCRIIDLSKLNFEILSKLKNFIKLFKSSWYFIQSFNIITILLILILKTFILFKIPVLIVIGTNNNEVVSYGNSWNLIYLSSKILKKSLKTRSFEQPNFLNSNANGVFFEKFFLKRQDIKLLIGWAFIRFY